MKVTACIPARMNSSRLPGKPLLDLAGKPILQWVYEKATSHSSISEVLVLTEDQEVLEQAAKFGAKGLMTSTNAKSGTDRIFEILDSLNSDVVINLQGDEPGITLERIDALIDAHRIDNHGIKTLCSKINSAESLFDFNVVKVVRDHKKKAMYFSRQAIPAQRDIGYAKWMDNASYYKHLGIYSFAFDTIKKLRSLKPSSLEGVEKLEQLRWLENGYDIEVLEVTEDQSFGIDTMDDLKKARELWSSK